MTLPRDPQERKQLQLYTFMFQYFPDAWLEVVRIARLGNEQHNPGQPLHWSRNKSTDQMNAVFNHLFDYGLGAKVDSDNGYHLAKLIWRAMAQLQLDIEQTRRIAGAADANKYQGSLVTPASADAKWPLPAGADGLATALSRTTLSGVQAPHHDCQPSASQARQCVDECGQAPPETRRR